MAEPWFEDADDYQQAGVTLLPRPLRTDTGLERSEESGWLLAIYVPVGRKRRRRRYVSRIQPNWRP